MFTEYLTVPGTKCLKNTIPLTKKKRYSYYFPLWMRKPKYREIQKLAPIK